MKKIPAAVWILIVFLAAAAAVFAVVRGPFTMTASAESVKWNKGDWTVSGEGDDAVYTAPERNFLGGITTETELEYNCIEYDVRLLDSYGTVDGNVGFCYFCGDAEYFFELNTVNNYLRIRLMSPTEGLKSSNTGFRMAKNRRYHFKIIVDKNVLRWFIDEELVAYSTDTKECDMKKGTFFIQGYNAQPQVKNIRFSNEDVVTTGLDFEFVSEDSKEMFTWTPRGAVSEASTGDVSGADGTEGPGVIDGEYVWPVSGIITSIKLDTAPGDTYSMKMPLRNTFCVRMKNDSTATKLKLSFVTDANPEYDDSRSKVFDILPESGYFTYYFNISDVEGARGYLRGFRLEALDAEEGTIRIDAITFEREAPVYEYAGSITSCTAEGEDITVKGTLKPEFAGKTVTIYETSITNYNFSKSQMKKVAQCVADGDGFIATLPLMNKKVSRLSSHFFAMCDGVFVSKWFTVENYYDFSENPYRFELPGREVVVTDSPYGARGDGYTNDTAAIQKAIDDVSAAGGGRVAVPGDGSIYGKRYIVTTLDIKSNVELYIDENAVLWQSPRPADYGYEVAYGHDVSIPGVNWTHAGLCHNYPLIYSHQADHVKLTGKGTIRLNDVGSECEDGVDGSILWTGCTNRIHLIAVAFVECNDVQISGITINRANCYHLNLFACSRAYVSDVTMNQATCASGDGIGLSASTHDVKVDRCFLYSNDDAVTMTSSYNDPRGLVWWKAKTDRDNSVRDVTVCHCDLFGGHGLTFITWGTDNPDLSLQEIYNVRAFDNVLSGGSSVGTWCDNPYYGGPFTNEETDDYSPVRDVRIYNNTYRSSCTLLSIKPTSLLTDCGINSASDFQNGDFERRNGKKGWVSGLSNWSVKGNRSDVSFMADASGNHYAVVAGDAWMYQGLYVKKSAVTVSFDVLAPDGAAGSGGAGEGTFFVISADDGRLLAEAPVTGAAAGSSGFSYTLSLAKGTFYFGVRAASGKTLAVDNFALKTGTYKTDNAAEPYGEPVDGFTYSKDVLEVQAEPKAILNPRYIAATEPVDERYVPGETDNEGGDDGGENGDNGSSEKSRKKLPGAAAAAIAAGAAAAVGGAIAAVAIAVSKKKKRKGNAG